MLTISNNNFPEQVASYIYKLEEIEHIVIDSSSIRQKISPLYSILVFNEGSGELEIGQQRYPINQQAIYMLPPETPVQLFLKEHSSIDYYYIQFHALQGKESGDFVPVRLDCPNELFIKYPAFLTNMANDVEMKMQTGNSWDAMEANIIFQGMMAVLFKDTISEEKSTGNMGITLTKDYIEKNYSLNIRREQLAEMVGMSADYYSRLFKKKVGKTPIEYLTDIRIKHAKKSLIMSNETSRSIAHSVGFKDEFYFSRKFKAETGFSPRTYVNKIKYSMKIASLKHLLTGHLLALDVVPYAAVINNVYPVTRKFHNTIAVGESNLDLDKLITAKPDLIITRHVRDAEEFQKEKIYDQIAPTVTLPFYQNWKVHLQTIANIIGREKEASLWLEHYEKKIEMIRKDLKDKVGEETLLIVGVGDGKLCIYGQRNIGTVLYGDLKLSIPKGVADITHYKEVSIEHLARFDADRILLTTYKHDGTEQMDRAVRRQVNRLFKNNQWNNLRAVKNEAVYCMYDRQHLYTCYTSHSHNLLLDKIYQLIMSDSYK